MAALSIARVLLTMTTEFDGFFTHNHPDLVQEHLGEIEKFGRLLHTEVLDKLHVLLAIALELPEDAFTKIHDVKQPC
jgi:hypothetical protein